MTETTAARRVVDLDALASTITDEIIEPTYALLEDVAPDGFLTFEAFNTGTWSEGVIVRATVDHVSDGEDEIAGATGEVVEIIVRRVTQ